MAKTSRNPELVRSVGKYSRSAMYKRRGVWAIKAKNGGKLPVHPKQEKPAEEKSRAPRFYPTEDVKQPKKKHIVLRPTKLRSSITPGTVLILLGGAFKGKRVIFLKQLTSGLLLVVGPYKVNGVPIRRVSQKLVIATSTKLDISSVDLTPFKLEDSYFAKTEKKAKKGESEFFDEEKDDEETVPEEKKEAVKAVDALLLPLIEKVPQLGDYLKSRFSLKSGQKPHEMIF
eukprot:TRINITY_DN35667_c0_g1_i1.p1 TRINITY_DN35667_c0_g1~~TRINITY_DN35667_c0_g1_i1.p1  ORF type:complete len:268 (+),score=66.08 TRINITY_DN35667_c0_g1_i1:118-804(+)